MDPIALVGSIVAIELIRATALTMCPDHRPEMWSTTTLVEARVLFSRAATIKVTSELPERKIVQYTWSQVWIPTYHQGTLNSPRTLTLTRDQRSWCAERSGSGSARRLDHYYCYHHHLQHHPGGGGDVSAGAAAEIAAAIATDTILVDAITTVAELLPTTVTTVVSESIRDRHGGDGTWVPSYFTAGHIADVEQRRVEVLKQLLALRAGPPPRNQGGSVLPIHDIFRPSGGVARNRAIFAAGEPPRYDAVASTTGGVVAMEG
jgi:hypothetical protein